MTDDGRLDPAVWKVIGVVLLGPLMAQMDSTIVNVSLSSIQSALHASLASAQWVISGYLLALALMLPLNGWIVDRLGAKRLYLLCFSVFTLTSALCGAARTMNDSSARGSCKASPGGLLAPLAQMMFARVAGRHMARVIGYAATPVLLAPTLGPIAAGAILKHLSWPWLFYVNLPLGVIAVVLAVVLLPNDEPLRARRSFDLTGFLLISPGLACLLFGLERIAHGGRPWFAVAGALFLIGFIWHAKRKKSEALIDLALFRNRVFANATYTQFLTNGVMYAGQFLIPLYLTVGCGLSAEKTGWMLLPMGIGMICVYPMMGRLTDRFGCRAVSAGGILLNALGTMPFLWMTRHELSFPVVAGCLFLRGVGQGATGVPTIAAAYASVRKSELGLATTALNISQRLGGPVATTLLAILTSLSTGPRGLSNSSAFFVPFLALNVLQFSVLILASRLPVRIPVQVAAAA